MIQNHLVARPPLDQSKTSTYVYFIQFLHQNSHFLLVLKISPLINAPLTQNFTHLRLYYELQYYYELEYHRHNFTFFTLLKTEADRLCSCYARNTPGAICRYKVDGIVSRPPALFTSMRRLMHGTSCPKSQLKSTCLTAKF